MASKTVQFLRYDKQKKSCKDCFHDCVCPHLRDDDAEKCGAYITDVAPVVHARWEYDDPISPNKHCTNCGESADLDFDNYFSIETPHCKKCGAKMDGERRNNGNL